MVERVLPLCGVDYQEIKEKLVTKLFQTKERYLINKKTKGRRTKNLRKDYIFYSLALIQLVNGLRFPESWLALKHFLRTGERKFLLVVENKSADYVIIPNEIELEMIDRKVFDELSERNQNNLIKRLTHRLLKLGIVSLQCLRQAFIRKIMELERQKSDNI